MKKLIPFTMVAGLAIFAGAICQADDKAALQQEMLNRFDANGDGKLSTTEKRVAAATLRRERQEQAAPAQNGLAPQNAFGGEGGPAAEGNVAGVQMPEMLNKEQLIAKFDGDGNGQLDAQERVALRQFAKEQEERLRQWQMQQFGMQGNNGGKRNPQQMKQFENARRELVRRFDRNRDGQLDAQEMAAAQAFMQQMRQRMQGQFGNGQFGNGQFGNGQFGNGQFGNGAFGNGQFPPRGSRKR